MSIVLALLIGPYQCGKSTFAARLSQHYKRNYPEYTCCIIFGNGNWKKQDDRLQEQQKLMKYLQDTITEFTETRTKERRVVICDYNIATLEERNQIYKICQSLNVVYVQVYFTFRLDQIFERNQQRLQKQELTFSQMLTRNCSSLIATNYQDWEMYNVIIAEHFLIDNNIEFDKFHLYVESLFNYVCIPVIFFAHNCTSNNAQQKREIKKQRDKNKALEHEDKSKTLEHDHKSKTLVHDAKSKTLEHDHKGKTLEHDAKSKTLEHDHKSKTLEHDHKCKILEHEDKSKTLEHDDKSKAINTSKKVHKHELEMKAGVSYRDKLLQWNP